MYQVASQEPKWLELFPARGKAKAVRALFVPPTRAAVKAASRAGSDAAAAGENGYEAYSVELIRRGLRDWEEIADASGKKALAFDAEGIETFLSDPGLYEAADAAYVTPYLVGVAEKNGLSLSPTGTSAGAKRTARAAKAPALSAPTRKTPRTPRKAAPSGK